MRTLLLAPVTLVFFLFIASHGPAAAGEARLMSGCLTNSGNIVKLSLGEEPNRPCTNLQVRLSFGIVGLNDVSPERFSLEASDSPVEGVRDRAAVILKLHFPF